MTEELADEIADEKFDDLLNFLVEKTKNVEKPFPLNRVIKEFTEETGALQTEGCLLMRIHKLRPMIQGLEEYDVETRMRMMFALSVKVDEEFLIELRKQAEVAVDDHNRIIEFKSANLYLSGVHKKLVKLTKEEHEMLQKLKNLCMKKGLPLTEMWLLNKKEEEDDVEDREDSEEDPDETITEERILKREKQLDAPRNSEMFPISSEDKENRKRKICSEGSSEDVKAHEADKYQKELKKRAEKKRKVPTRKVFESLYSFISCFESERLIETRRKIKKTIKETPLNIQTSIKTIEMALIKGEEIITKSSVSWSRHESISLKLVLLQLKRLVKLLDIRDFDGFQRNLRKRIERLALVDQFVPLRKLNKMIKTTVITLWGDME